MYVSLYYMCGGESGHQILWRGSCGWLWATIWVLAAEPGSPRRTVSTLNSRAISPVPIFWLLNPLRLDSRARHGDANPRSQYLRGQSLSSPSPSFPLFLSLPPAPAPVLFIVCVSLNSWSSCLGLLSARITGFSIRGLASGTNSCLSLGKTKWRWKVRTVAGFLPFLQPCPSPASCPDYSLVPPSSCFYIFCETQKQELPILVSEQPNSVNSVDSAMRMLKCRHQKPFAAAMSFPSVTVKAGRAACRDRRPSLESEKICYCIFFTEKDPVCGKKRRECTTIHQSEALLFYMMAGWWLLDMGERVYPYSYYLLKSH